LVPEKKPAAKRKRRRIPRYHVVLWDSDKHSYEYVERMLRELFGHAPEECHKMAVTVDTQGKVVVLTTTKEHAELKRDQILAYGKDDLIRGCTGSMHATIESAD
jgi:ATP-dependent Clp protease adaptor protein ClpS